MGVGLEFGADVINTNGAKDCSWGAGVLAPHADNKNEKMIMKEFFFVILRNKVTVTFKVTVT